MLRMHWPLTFRDNNRHQQKAAVVNLQVRRLELIASAPWLSHFASLAIAFTHAWACMLSCQYRKSRSSTAHYEQGRFSVAGGKHASQGGEGPNADQPASFHRSEGGNPRWAPAARGFGAAARRMQARAQPACRRSAGVARIPDRDERRAEGHQPVGCRARDG